MIMKSSNFMNDVLTPEQSRTLKVDLKIIIDNRYFF
jgi:hypothetical protein